MTQAAEATEATNVGLIDPNRIPHMWEILRPMLARACEYSGGEFTPEVVAAGTIDGLYRMIGYFADDALVSVAVLRVSILPAGGRIMEVLLASGERLRDWRAFYPQLEAYAAANDCTKFRMIGRKGLRRMLPDWTETAIVMERDIG